MEIKNCMPVLFFIILCYLNLFSVISSHTIVEYRYEQNILMCCGYLNNIRFVKKLIDKYNIIFDAKCKHYK